MIIPQISGKFWDRVRECTHEWSPEYCVSYYCTCGNAAESHCLKCGVYKTEDPCGEQTGMSGWGKKRAAAQRRINLQRRMEQ